MKSRVIKIILVGVSLIFGLGLIELGLRLINYPYLDCPEVKVTAENKIGQFDNMLGWSYIPKSSAVDENINYIFNEEGYRSSSIDSKTDFSKPIIMIVGDSIIFGHGINFEDTFGYKLQKMVGEKYQVVNMAVQGYGLDQTYLKLEPLMDKYKPKFVVLETIDDDGRNVNNDRRSLFACIKTSGSKPMFENQNGALVQKYFPEKYTTYDNPRIGLVLKRVRDKLRMMDKNKWKLTNLIYINLHKLVTDHNSKLLVLNYWMNIRDVQIIKDELLPAVVKKDEMIGMTLADEYHPNTVGTSFMLDKFMKNYGNLINTSF